MQERLKECVFQVGECVFHVFPIVFSKQGSAQFWIMTLSYSCQMGEASSPWYIYAFSEVEEFHSVIFLRLYKLCKAKRLSVEEEKTLL